MAEVNATQWDRFIAQHPQTHLLQTTAWGEFKGEFGWDVVRVVVGDVGAQILIRRLPLGFTFAYLPKGPVGNVWDPLWPMVDKICTRRRSIFLKIEPDIWADTNDKISSKPPQGFIQSPQAIQPLRTFVIDLQRDEADILVRMKQKTRYNIRLAERKGVKISSSSDIKTFYDMMEVTGQRDAFGLHRFDYYQRVFELFHPIGSCELFLATYESKPIAGLMVFSHGHRAWYFYGASTDLHRNFMPNHLLQWEAIRWAKRRGCDQYDLWGVPDESASTLEAEFSQRSDGLWGVYRFKRGFGGHLKRAAGPWDRVYRSPFYPIYRWWANRRADGS